MNKSVIKILAWMGLSVMLLTGCKTVVSMNPVGIPDTEIKKEQYEGIWQIDEGAIQCKFAKDGKTLVVGGVEWNDDAQEYKLQQIKVDLRKIGDRRFLNLLSQDDDTETTGPRYFFAEYNFKDGNEEYILLWYPDFGKFKEAIEENKIVGSATDDTVTITEKPESLMTFLQQYQDKDLFNYREPIIIRRIAR